MNVKDEITSAVKLIQRLPYVVDSALIGSAMYMPDTEVGDVDFAVLLEDSQNAVDYIGALCQTDGWEACGDYDSDKGTWGAVRRGNLNLMLTHDREFFNGYKLAMEVCKVLHLKSKDDRIAVCRVVRDRVPADIVRPQMPEAFL